MPQPIDMQTELARTVIVDRVQEISGRASMVAQQRALSEAEEDRVVSETQVEETKETDNERVDADGRRRNPYVGRRKRRRRSKAGAAETSKVFYTAHEGKDIASDPDDHELDVTV